MSLSNQPSRGIIVVDADQLELLAASRGSKPIKPGSPLHGLVLTSQSTGSYLDLLTVLAKHGWKIIIPEMVAVESARVMADGTRLDQFFDNRHDLQYPTQNTVQEFICSITHKEPNIGHKNIDIREAKESSEPYAKLLQRYRKAIINYKRDLDPGPVRSAIVGSTKECADLKDKGDEHCYDVIIKELKDHPQVPVYLLSSDAKSRRRLEERLREKEVNVNLLTVDGILNGLEKDHVTSGVENLNALTLCGFQEKASDIWQTIKSQSTNELPEFIGGKDNYHDRAIKPEKGQSLPFANAIKGFANDLQNSPWNKFSKKTPLITSR